jgi:hypothetical protein
MTFVVLALRFRKGAWAFALGLVRSSGVRWLAHFCSWLAKQVGCARQRRMELHMDRIIRAAIQLAAFCCFSFLAAAGVVIRWESGEAGAKEKRKSTVYVEAGKIRVESEDARGVRTVTIFDGEKGVLWSIHPEEGSYTEVTSETIARLSQQVQQTMKLVQERMGSLPTELRASLEEALKATAGGPYSAPSTVTFRAKGESDKVGSLTCAKYDQLANGQLTAEICAAPFDQLHLTDADQKNFQAMAGFGSSVGRVWNINTFQGEQQPGFPIHTVTYVEDKPVYESTVLSVDQKPLGAVLFSLPAGLKRNEIPFIPPVENRPK